MQDNTHEEHEKVLYVLKWFIIASIGFTLAMGIFCAGVYFGQARANFSYRWAENYHKNFGGPEKGFFGNFPSGGMVNSHGVFGTIISVSSNVLLVEDQSGVEKMILVSNKTIIRSANSKIINKKISVGDSIVVIGSPNSQGQIEATFIRVMPAQLAPTN